jgi:hypothetical protein
MMLNSSRLSWDENLQNSYRGGVGQENILTSTTPTAPIKDASLLLSMSRSPLLG